jgi:hypothetical protein
MIEAHKRLAPHFQWPCAWPSPSHPQSVTKATYLALWWPQMHIPVYAARTPLWDDGAYRDPDTG